MYDSEELKESSLGESNTTTAIKASSVVHSQLTQSQDDTTNESGDNIKFLSSCIAKTELAAHSYTQKVTELLNKPSEEIEVKDLTLNEIVLQSEALAKNENTMPHLEYIGKSRQMVRAIEKGQDKMTIESKRSREVSNEIYLSKNDIEEQLEEFYKKDTFGEKLTVFEAFRKMKLNSRLGGIEAQLDGLVEGDKERNHFEYIFFHNKLDILSRQHKLLINEVGKDIKVEYDRLGEAIVKEGTLPREIRNIYIKQVVTPSVEKISKENGYTEEEKKKIYLSLKSIIDNQDASQEQKEIEKEKFLTFFNDTSEFLNVKNAYDILSNKEDEAIVQSLVTSMSKPELKLIEEVVKEYFFSHGESVPLSSIEELKANLKEYGDTPLYEDMGLWNALKSSKSARDLFSDTILQRDDEMYKAVIENALFDEQGDIIDMLYYYPTPDAIRLLYLAAGGDYGSFTTEKANKVIDRLSKDAGWKQILDKAQEVYPALSGVRESLENWKLSEEGFAAIDYTVVGELAISLVDNVNDLKKPVIKSVLVYLNSETYLNILSKLELLDKQTSNSIAKAMVYLSTIPKSEDILNANVEIFDRKLKYFLQPLFFQYSETNKDLIPLIKERVGVFSQFILNKKSDLNALSYLLNPSVTNKLLDDSASFDNIEAFLGAYEQIPTLLKEEDLLNIFCKDYKGEHSVASFKDIETTYSKYGGAVISKMVFLISNEKLSMELALKLPKIADNIFKSPSISLALERPEMFLESKEGREFFNMFTSAYEDRGLDVQEVVASAIYNENITKEFSLQLPQIASEVLSSPLLFIALQKPTIFLDSEESRENFNKFTIAYKDQELEIQNDIAILIVRKEIDVERALQLPKIAPEVLKSSSFNLAFRYPKLFLETDESLDFFQKFTNGKLSDLGEDFDSKMGRKVIGFGANNIYITNRSVIGGLTREKLSNLKKVVSQFDQAAELREAMGWEESLMGYIESLNPRGGESGLFFSPDFYQRIESVFKDPKMKDICFNGLRERWVSYLDRGVSEELPFSLYLVSNHITAHHGAGPLSKITALNGLIESCNKVFLRRTTVERTKVEILQGLRLMEERFDTEKWSNDERINFYNISSNIIDSVPSIFTDFLVLFNKLSPADIKKFTNEVFPLYGTKFIMMENMGTFGEKNFGKEQLMDMRSDIRNFSERFGTDREIFEIQSVKLRGEIVDLFKGRFGVIKIPERFTSEDIRSLTNMSTYLSNIVDRTPEKETILAFYLSMMINNKWDDFKQGVQIDPDELLISEKSKDIKQLIKERDVLNPLTASNLGLKSEEMPEFLELMHQEVSNMVLGNIETIDVRLTKAILNLQALDDLDLYTDPFDREKMALLLNYGNKQVGSVVARVYQQLINPTRVIQFSEQEEEISQSISKIMADGGVEVTPELLKEHFQDGLRPFSMIVNMMNFIEDTEAEAKINSFKSLLEPTDEMIRIFEKLDEEFKPTSEVFALSQNLNSLESLINKKEDRVTVEEGESVREYISRIREQMDGLEGIYSQMGKRVDDLVQNRFTKSNALLVESLKELNEAVHTQVDQQIITSTITDNLNIVIENIRKCLSCKSEGCNNDTNLTFGDMNKFYIYTQREGQSRDSIADQLVLVEPIVSESGVKGMAFILDRIYGSGTPVVFQNNIQTVLKKIEIIKQRFPNINLSLFIPSNISFSGGMTTGDLLEYLEHRGIPGKIESITVDVAKSAMGDPYIEFVPNTQRKPGRRTGLQGIVINT